MIVLACITALALVDSDSWQKTFLAINLSAIAFMNVFNAVFQGEIDSFARITDYMAQFSQTPLVPNPRLTKYM